MNLGIKFCDKEGYDIMSAYMVRRVLASKGEQAKSNQYDKEIILEGPNTDYLRISTTITPPKLSIMPINIKITSIKDVHFDFY